MKGRELHCAVCVHSLLDTKVGGHEREGTALCCLEPQCVRHQCGHGREGTVLHAEDMAFQMVVSLPWLPGQVLGSEGI